MGLSYVILLMGLFYVPSLLYILCMIPPSLHKMVPIYRVPYLLLWVHLMYNNYCRVLLLYIRDGTYIGRNIVNQIMWCLTLLPLQCFCKTLYLVLSCVEAKKTMQGLLRDVVWCCKEVPIHQKRCGCTECSYMCCSAACQ